MTMENLLERNVKKEYLMNSGAGGIVSAMVGLIIGIILSVGVALPVTVEVTADQNITGIAGTILPYVSVFVVLIPIMLVATFL